MGKLWVDKMGGSYELPIAVPSSARKGEREREREQANKPHPAGTARSVPFFKYERGSTCGGIRAALKCPFPLQGRAISDVAFGEAALQNSLVVLGVGCWIIKRPARTP